RRGLARGQVARQRRQLQIGARRLRQLDALGELLERQAAVDDGGAQQLDALFALGVGGEQRWPPFGLGPVIAAAWTVIGHRGSGHYRRRARSGQSGIGGRRRARRPSPPHAAPP